ncbi:hypothetical protein ACLBXM_08350 [Xanthobacteraceae bacterium A53D]
MGMLTRRVLLAGLAACLLPLPAAAAPLSEAALTWREFMSSAGSLAGMPTKPRKERLDKLASALKDDPMGVCDELEAGIGGRFALRAYVTAMLDFDQSAALVDQLFLVLSAGRPGYSMAEALGKPQKQDGSVWFPLAEQAGFFTGGLASVLDGHRQGAAVGLIVQKLRVPPPAPEDTVGTWLLAALDKGDGRLTNPAESWFQSGFAKAYRR